MKILSLDPTLWRALNRKLAAAIILLGTSAAWGEPMVAEADNSPPKEEKSLEENFIETNIAVSHWFDGVAEGLDLFLAGKRLTNQRNETRVRVENSSYWIEHDKNLHNTTSIAVLPKLPNLEKYWMLKFTSYDERAENRGVANDYLRQRPRQTNYGATIGVFKKLGDVRTAFQPRIELQDPLRVSHSLIFESVADMKTYEINPKIEFWATPTRGTGIFQALNFNFHPSKRYTLTWVNEGDYEEKTHIYRVTNGLSLGQLLTAKTSLSYNAFYFSLNQPNYHLQAYSFSVSWNEILYKNMLDYQIIPHVDFDRDNGFRAVSGLTFNINLNF